MTASQRLSIRLSEIRQRLNTLAGEEAPTDDHLAEIDTLSVPNTGQCETQYRAARSWASRPPPSTPPPSKCARL